MMRSLAVFLLLTACVAETDDVLLEEIVDLPNSPASEWTIDLREPAVAWEVSGLLAARMSEIDLICPDGQETNLKAWVEATNLALDTPLNVEQGIVLAAFESVARAALPGSCTPEQRMGTNCHLCPDGAWVCEVPPVCQEASARRSDADEPARPDDFTNRTPNEPRQGAPNDPRDPGDNDTPPPTPTPPPPPPRF